MIEAIKGDGLNKEEIKKRKIKIVDGTRGGIELHAPTYDQIISTVLMERGFLDDVHISAACDYLELKNSVYGFLNVKTMAGILQTGDAGTKREHAESAYYIAARYIGTINDRLITHAMHDIADDTLNMIMVVEAYRMAFHSVADGMREAIKAIKDEMNLVLA